jgi:hypothetical protein
METNPISKMLGPLEFGMVKKVQNPSSPESFRFMAKKSIALTL